MLTSYAQYTLKSEQHILNYFDLFSAKFFAKTPNFVVKLTTILHYIKAQILIELVLK